jgi:hypothetical protein
MNPNLVMGQTFIEKKLSDNSKKQYSKKIEHFEQWVENVHPEQLSSDGTVNYHGLDRYLVEFFGHISRKRRLQEETGGQYVYEDPPVLQSIQHVGGYNSAIKYAFSKKRLRVSDSVEMEISDLFGGYEIVLYVNQFCICY